MCRHRKANKLGPGKIAPFSQAAWSNCGMTVLQGPEESADPPILSDSDERQIYKSGKVTKYMGHTDFKDFFSLFLVCSCD